MMSVSATRVLARPATTDASSARSTHARRAVPLAARRAFASPPASFATRARARLAVSTVTRAAIFQNAAAKQQAVARLEAQLAPCRRGRAPASDGRQLEDEPRDAAGG
jgi:hypothetical protein